MAAAAGDLLYWCHQCNAQTRPIVGEDVVCSLCSGGFIEEMDSTEVEPGVAFSTLPLALGNILRRPSPASVGISRSRSTIDPQQEAPAPAPSQQQQTEPQGHRPRLLSRQLSHVPSLLEAMMQVVEEFNAPFPRASSYGPSTPGHFAPDDGRHGSRGPGLSAHDDDNHTSPHASSHGSDASGRGDNHEHTHAPTLDHGHAFVFPESSPMLILHGGMPNGFRSLEVFIDNGQGLGPQMMPNHLGNYFLGPELDRLIQFLAENDQNRYGTPPAAKAAVEKLPKFKITQEHMGSDTLQCAVCKDDFELEAEVQQMPCKHVYHPDCILPWLAEHNSCPVCRFELPTDDADYEARKKHNATSGQSNSNQPEEQGTTAAGHGEGGSPAGRERSEVPGQFTLWGMPAMGFDMTRLSTLGSNELIGLSEDGSENRRGNNAGVDPGASPGAGGSPVHWLFRLFSSGSLPTTESTGSGGEQSRETGNESSPSNS